MTTTSSRPVVLAETDENVTVVTFDRPEARNALNRQLLKEFQVALDNAVADPRVGAIVLTGNGPAFCAGADLKEASSGMEDDDFWGRYERANQSLRIHHELPRLPKPVIAAVNGYAVAGGCGVAMSCDIVFAGESAQFGYPEVNRGLVAAMVMVSLSRIVGRRQALDLLLSGRLIKAEEALRLGMINRVVADDQVRSEAVAYAHVLASKPGSAVRVTKELFRQIAEIDYDRGLEYARDVNQMIRQTGDAKRGAAAFANRTERS